MDGWLNDALLISIAMMLVVLNGFFVAAEFALVKVRLSQIDALVQAGRPFAKTARWLTCAPPLNLSQSQ